ncbi:hypothetical protein ISN45_At01g023450 [Arabidopsis thaliana x Arabidopsis arenosa]|uniref:Uncharacterized protein n=2 Tax=Arabidopsis TaxID=3701 RepID=A0A8T2H961_ARASU|nr:hypothetical protein ISN45_At01g023450 [Arabidopsis thaliana x Arabidopsis arenosa]KAG7655264.1 hypothetical protein ISN44_As01g023520 [Arabidopsis suecica]
MYHPCCPRSTSRNPLAVTAKREGLGGVYGPIDLMVTSIYSERFGSLSQFCYKNM